MTSSLDPPSLDPPRLDPQRLGAHTPATEDAFGVYVHVPWCRRRCPYCDFYFEVGPHRPGFAERVATELAWRAGEAPAQRPAASSLSFGGGSPSTLPAAEVAKVVELVDAKVGLRPGAEVSLEVNPEDASRSTIAGWKAAGVTRLSLGIQSYDAGALRFLGRAHDATAAARATKQAASSLPTSVDIIGGLNLERGAAALGRVARDLDRALELGVSQVSLYLLTIEEGTEFGRRVQSGRLPVLDDDLQADVYELVQDRMDRAGFVHVEVSSWARPPHEPVHNRIYWAGGTYLGLGPGAHSMLRNADGSVTRRQTPQNIDAWMRDPAGRDDASPAAELETLGPERAFLEAVAFGLRDLERGVDVESLARRHHTRVWPAVVDALAEHGARGRLRFAGDRVRLTAEGALFADAVARTVLGVPTDPGVSADGSHPVTT